MIRIGVTGHRKVTNPQRISQSIQKVLGKVRNRARNADPQSVQITVISPLAEGADRIVAREVLLLPKSRLEAVLPLEPMEYMKDFGSTASRQEFSNLLQRAEVVHRIGPQQSRSEAYFQAGKYVVDSCDLLIAVWDGEKGRGRGGTTEVVYYARRVGKPLVWIHADRPEEIREEKAYAE